MKEREINREEEEEETKRGMSSRVFEEVCNQSKSLINRWLIEEEVRERQKKIDERTGVQD